MDHRASIKIEMEFHGVKDSCDMYVNYYPEDDGMDQRVSEFFRSVYERGMAVYNDSMAKRSEEEKECWERAEYKRLEQKYGKAPWL